MVSQVGSRVMVVDDDDAVRATVTAILEASGIAATGHATGADALADDGPRRAAVALVDYRLPDTSGLELASALKEADPEIRVLLMTGHASMESAIESVGRVDEYLIKPVQPQALLQSVRNALSRHTLAVENQNLVDRLQRLTNYQALYDPLTRLPNRMLLTDRLHEALTAEGSGGRVAVLFVDLDGFKLVNDSLGHRVGDQILRSVAERLDVGRFPEQTAARFGGDEFVLVCPGTETEADALAKAEQVLAALREPLGVAGIAHWVDASVGVVLAPTDGAAAPDLLVQDAETAMYAAKAQGRGLCLLYEETMRDRVIQRYDVERGVREAYEAGHLGLVYQPIIDLATAEVVGAEALLRWYRPGAGTVLPGDFLPVAEDAGLGLAIGRFVIERALDELAGWRARGLVDDSFRLWINASPQQMADPALPGIVADALARHQLPGSMVGLEVVEEALADIGATVEVLTELRALGLSINLDDFGAGHSNLAWLQELPITGLKIDRRFVSGLDVDSDQRGPLIVRGLIDLGHALGLKLLGEGVERPDQARLLTELGCDQAQGYHFGYPVSAEELWGLPA